MTPKTEAESLGEQITECLRYGGAAGNRKVDAARAAVIRLVALATSEPPAPQAVTEDYCGVSQTTERHETRAGTLYEVAKWTCPNCGKPCSVAYIDGEHCHGDPLCLSFGPEKEPDGRWKTHAKCGACWLGTQAVGERLPLTDAEFDEIGRAVYGTMSCTSQDRKFGRLVEAAGGIKALKEQT